MTEKKREPKKDERGEKARAAAAAAAFEQIEWTLWAMSGDKHDIHDGEHPIGEQSGKVLGMTAAISRAKQLLAGDPGIRHVRIEPRVSNSKIRPMIVKRPVTGNEVDGPLSPWLAGENEA